MSTCKVRYVVAIVVGVGSFFINENLWTTTSPASFTTQAEARIGRPLTPFSVAGVARRTTRRAVAAGAIAGGAYLGYGYGSGYGYPSYGSSYGSGYGYPFYNPSYGGGVGYGYPSYGGTSYGNVYGYPSYGSSYGYYGYRFPSYAGSYGLFRPWGWR